MSTQPQELPKLPALENPCLEEEKSVLDEPWRVRFLPDEPEPPSADVAPVRKSLPWKAGDVTRLGDDTPEGMMRYIATHTSGWWRDMAERALRDTEKAKRMAEDAGWKPGQYWTLEVDVEARDRMRAEEEARRAREEARRAREEAERAKEQAEKEAFAARQMELLKKAGRAPRCEYLYTDGRGCRAPQVRGEHWCHGHARMMNYRPEKLELLPMEDEKAVMVNLYRVTRSLTSGRITEKVAGLALWSIAIGAPGARRRTKTHHGDAHPSKPESGLPGTPGAETRRKSEKQLPQVNTDGRRAERRSSRESTRRLANLKTKIHRGDAEARRKTRKELPPINADKHRSEKSNGAKNSCEACAAPHS